MPAANYEQNLTPQPTPAPTPMPTPAPTPAPTGMMGAPVPTPAPTPAPVQNFANTVNPLNEREYINSMYTAQGKTPYYDDTTLNAPAFGGVTGTRNADGTITETAPTGPVTGYYDGVNAAYRPAGMMGAPAPAPAPAANAPATTSTPANANILNWYRNAAGRDATAQEIAFHQQNVASLGAEAAYAEFVKGLGANSEMNRGLNFNQANAAYNGYQSQDGGSMVDDWARNVFGRAATPQELAAFGSATTPQEAQAQYAAFLSAARANGEQGGNLSLIQASQLLAPAGTPPASAPATGTNDDRADTNSYQSNNPNALTYKPRLDRQINARDETIEGRVNGLMATDAQGNYTNPVVRQAVDRATQQFAARGLRNSSMAVQAGIEAATAKAIEIAGPDAQRYYEQGRANQDAGNQFSRDELQFGYDINRQNDGQQHDAFMQNDAQGHAAWMQNDAQGQEDYMADKDRNWRDRVLTAEQSFTLRQNYIEANDNASARYNAAVNNINASNMTPEDKNIAIQQAAAARDGDLVYNNRMFAAQPGWANEWLGMAVSTEGVDVSAITNPDTLQNIANDPAQSAAIRQQARAKLSSLGGSSGPGSPQNAPEGGAPGSTEATGALPARVNGQTINWNAPLGQGQTLATMFAAYKAGGGVMDAAEWVRIYGGGSGTNLGGGPGNATSPGDNSDGVGPGAGGNPGPGGDSAP